MTDKHTKKRAINNEIAEREIRETGGRFNGLGFETQKPQNAELVLLFNTDNLTDVEGQLGKAFDDFSVAGDMRHIPSLMIVRKEVWLALETELIKKLKHKSYKPENIKDYDATSSKSTDTKVGYNAIIFRGRAVVAIDGKNIVADKVGANDL